MPFKAILEELVRAVDGAEGAIVVESDGEAVQWYPENSPDQLRLRAAYVALSAESCQESLKNLKLKNTKSILLQYQGASFLAADLGSGYFLILELNTKANIAQAMNRIQGAAEIVRKEIM